MNALSAVSVLWRRRTAAIGFGAALAAATLAHPSARAGVTILCHGLNLSGDSQTGLQYWGNNNIAALAAAAGGGRVYLYDTATGAFELQNYAPFTNPGVFNVDGEFVLVFDWGPPSNNLESGQAEAAADALFAALVDANADGVPDADHPGFGGDGGIAGILDSALVDLAHPEFSLPLHFIGHSRGVPVASETAERLALYGVPVDYFTALDSHDFGESAVPFDELFHDPATQIWDNVLHADNFWQSTPQTCNPSGRALAHILPADPFNSVYLTPLADFNHADCGYIPHSLVKDFYWGTITPGSENPVWYGGNPANYGFARWQAGGGYLRPADSAALLTRTDVRTRASLFPFVASPVDESGGADDNGPPPAVFDGNFNLANLGLTQPAGWSFHGGSCTSTQVRTNGAAPHERFARISSGGRMTHNRAYLPERIAGVRMQCRFNGAGNASIRVLSLACLTAPTAQVFSVTAAQVNIWAPVVYPVPGCGRDAISQLEIRNTSASSVDVDDIEFLLAADTNCDGAVNNFDIDPFVIALTDASAYALLYPNCDRISADANGDGLVNNFDIDSFVASILGQ